MSKIEDNIDLVNDKIDDEVNRFLEGVDKSQKGIFNRLLGIVKGVETDQDGNIKQTVKNLKLLASVRKTIENEIITDAYIGRVDSLSNQFPAIASLNNGYFETLEAAFDPNRELFKEVVKNSINATRASLLDSGVSENVINPIVKIVDDSVTSGAGFADMVDELRVIIKGDPERLGQLMRYSKQITQDALNQFNATYNETIARDLDLEWYFYSGGKRSTSRPFCKKYAGRYFHKKEVEDFGKRKDLDGSSLCSGPNLCEGRIKGTNSSNIFRYRGGYNCKHIYKPTLIDSVPSNVVNRNVKKGYYISELVQPVKPLDKNITVSKLIKTSEKEGSLLQSNAEDIAKKYNATTTPLNLKKEASIKRKLAADNAIPSDIKDAVRTTIVAPKSQINKIIAEYEKRGLSARVKRQNFDNGYTGTIINVHTNGGILGEVQVNTPRMIYAKEKRALQILGEKQYNAIKKSTGLPSGQGHKLYEELRVLEAKVKKTPKEIIRMNEVFSESKEYYSHFQ